LIQAQAVLETAVEFTEEYSSVLEQARKPIDLVIHECSLTTQRYLHFKEGSEEPKIVLVGSPNAGKSSLFNALLCRNRALVHQTPGTTRDVIEETVLVGDHRCRLVDTAGLRVADQSIEQAGIELGRDYLRTAAYWILVVDGTLGVQEEEGRLLEQLVGRPGVVFWNKADLSGFESTSIESSIEGSAKEGQGVVALWEKIRDELPKIATSQAPLPSNTQYRRLADALVELGAVRVGFEEGLPPEILSEGIRRAMSQLESVLGPVETDDILGRIFSEFCIGK